MQRDASLTGLLQVTLDRQTPAKDPARKECDAISITSFSFGSPLNLAADVLSQANEAFDRKYELKHLGYDLDRAAARVAECFWAVRELGISLTESATRLRISVSALGYSVERDEIIARENDYQLIE